MYNSLGVYIHIPFCDGKCCYCDFFSEKHSESEIDNYISALINSIKSWGTKAVGRTVDSIYFGGGTPGLIGTKRLISLLNAVISSFSVFDPEVTFEVNPLSSSTLDFSALRGAGFNRVSIGLQSANERELQILGRHHSPLDAKATVKRAADGGFKNISVDLMIGIPEQTEDSLMHSLSFILSQKITHISCYMLKLEENTPMYLNRDKYIFPDDDGYARLYELTCKELNKQGFIHYEISNFCKRGFESRHNLKYWKLGEYIGIGPSAHSFFQGKRFYYSRSFDEFFQGITHYDGIGGNYEEFIMLSLRLKSGLDLNEFEKKYGFGIPRAVFEKISFLEKHRLLNFNGRTVSLTEKGFMVSNEIILQILEAFNKEMK